MASRSPTESPDEDHLDAGSLTPRTMFQPIVELESGSPIGYEALSRGPAGTALESPTALFAAAEAVGRLTELDRRCRDLALARALGIGMVPPLTVFLNVESATLRRPGQPDADATWSEAPERLRCCIEITERAITSRPAELLRVISEIRDMDWGLALDDVGADARSLALMPMLRPDVVKLDLRVVRDATSVSAGAIMSAVTTETETTGALVVAEGIETVEQAELALALGATHGQGYLYGRPVERSEVDSPAAEALRFLGSPLPPPGAPTPFELAQRHLTARRGPRQLLEAMAGHLLNQAAGEGPAAVVLISAASVSQSIEQRMHQIAPRAALTARLSPTETDGPLRVGRLALDDPLSREWNLVVAGPHFLGAVLARSTDGAGLDPEAPHEFVLTHHRELVVECARNLLARLAPQDAELAPQDAG